MLKFNEERPSIGSLRSSFLGGFWIKLFTMKLDGQAIWIHELYNSKAWRLCQYPRVEDLLVLLVLCTVDWYITCHHIPWRDYTTLSRSDKFLFPIKEQKYACFSKKAVCFLWIVSWQGCICNASMEIAKNPWSKCTVHSGTMGVFFKWSS